MKLRPVHFGMKMVLPYFHPGEYFIPERTDVSGVFYGHDTHGREDYWYPKDNWDFYPGGADAPTCTTGDLPPEDYYSYQDSPEEALPSTARDYSLLEAVRSGRRFRSTRHEDIPESWIYVNPQDDVLYWVESGEPFVMCEFNLAARYLLEPEPRAPALVTEETFDSAWKKAFEIARKKTDCTFRECLKEALGLKGAAAPKQPGDR